MGLLDSLTEGGDGAGGMGPVSASQRASLMTKLAQNAGMHVPDNVRLAANLQEGALAQGGGAGAARCVVLKNMFDRLSEEARSNPSFFAELEKDVRGECAKLGLVLHCACDKWSNGFVYVKMMQVLLPLARPLWWLPLGASSPPYGRLSPSHLH